MTARIFTDARCLRHSTPAGYPEVRERLEGILTALAGSGRVAWDLGEHPEAAEAVARIHSPSFVARFEQASARGDDLLDSADNPLSAGTWDAAWGAVSAALHAADSVRAAGPPQVAFAAIRPPGHHAEAERAMGFCFFNNVAIAAGHLRAHGYERVAILDFDVHHGNGTQDSFYDRADVLYLSAHQFPFYPGSGRRDERGAAAGKGFTCNAPLPAGSGDAEYEGVWRSLLLPALDDFRPGALLLSAGFDAWVGDPLGGMRVTEEAFRQWGRWAATWAARASAPILAVLEGGYDLKALPGLVLAHLEGLEGGFGDGQSGLASPGADPD